MGDNRLETMVARIDERTQALSEGFKEYRETQAKRMDSLENESKTHGSQITQMKRDWWWLGVLCAFMASFFSSVTPSILERARGFVGTSEAREKPQLKDGIPDAQVENILTGGQNRGALKSEVKLNFSEED